MAKINPKITIRSVYFGMLLLSAAVMISAVRLTVASDLDSLKAAAEQGDATAQVNLGAMYSTGEGVPENDTEAARWFRMAAEQGDATAQYNLGIMYSNGRGVPKIDAEAARWFRMAAEQEIAEAQFNLGIMYSNGRGVPQNDAEAARWFRMAAGNLGVMYADVCRGGTGEGIPKAFPRITYRPMPGLTLPRRKATKRQRSSLKSSQK